MNSQISYRYKKDLQLLTLTQKLKKSYGKARSILQKRNPEKMQGYKHAVILSRRLHDLAAINT